MEKTFVWLIIFIHIYNHKFLSKYELFIVLFIFAFSVAAPVTVTRFVDASPTGYDWRADWVKGFPIDLSCNATQYNQLSTGLQEAQLLAEHARDHTLRFGSKSPFSENTLEMRLQVLRSLVILKMLSMLTNHPFCFFVMT